LLAANPAEVLVQADSDDTRRPTYASAEPSDFETLVCIVAEASDPTATVTWLARKQQLLERLARLIEADVWIWNLGAISPYVHGAAAPLNFVDGGWDNRSQRAAAIAQMLDPGEQSHFLQPVSEAVRTAQPRTFVRSDLIPDELWSTEGNRWRETGLDDFVLSVQPLSPETFSSVVFYRRIGRPAFHGRERQLVGLAVGQVRWLHRHGVELRKIRHAVGLAPRTREALVHLLAGESKKGVAALMGISEHTVGDYLKQIYKHFGVRGRAQLFAVMVNGGLP